MKMRRILCAVLAVLMAAALVPMAALASGLTDEESKELSKLDKVWEVLEKVEAEAKENGAGVSDVTMAVYKAALQLDLVDEKSFNSLTFKSFFFTVDGMACCYDYSARNYDAAEPLAEPAVITVPGTKNAPASANVLLVGPYYGQDGSFTDQYKEESLSIAAVTGGSRTLLQSSGATGPAIAAAVTNAGVVIYDSHGTQSGNSSYLCLTTNSGITQQDYQNGWAVNAGGAAYIDGRYIQHHITGTLPNNIFWMAICEGMKRQGQGTTGNALLDAGAACVYGYSQSVTFAGDYEYEATFWNEMKYNDATVAEAIAEMKEVHGIPDPYGDAYPIVMSATDSFPANPDGPQNVTCDWTLRQLPPVALESYSLSESAISVYESFTEVVDFVRVPDNANQYELEWFSENNAIATVNGTNRKVKITGVSAGTTRIYCSVKVDGAVIGNAYCNVNVIQLPTLSVAANAPGGTLNFTSTTNNYPWRVGIVDGEPVAMSGNSGVGNSTSTMQLVLQMQAGETLSFRWKCSSEEGYDYFRFKVNGSNVASLDGETGWITRTYTAASTGTYTFQWSFEKDPYVDGVTDAGYVDNVIYSGMPTYINGDADGDGEVSMNDALFTLRAAMGIMTPSAEEIQRMDFDHDGTVSVSDALFVLRKAMGIIA